MASFLCSLWPLLLAGTIGWLLSGLLGRLMRRNVDSAASLVSTKDNEISTLRTELDTIRRRPPVEKIIEKPVEKIVTVEKIVDRPVEKIVTGEAGNNPVK